MSETTLPTPRTAGPRRNRRRVGPALALVLLIALILYALVVPLLAPASSGVADYAAAGLPPSSSHLLGTDSEGRDLLVRTAAGLRLSLAIGTTVALIATTVGTTVGIIAGFTGGIVDQVLMRGADTINALPHLILGLVIVGMFRGSITAIIVAMVITHWVTVARIVRAQTLSLRDSELVASGWLTGMSRIAIARRILAPAVIGQAMISVVLTIPHIVWHESTFSFLGIGLPPHEPSLGTLISDAEGGLLLGQWWLLVFPGGALVLATLCTSVLGRALTDRVTVQEEA